MELKYTSSPWRVGSLLDMERMYHIFIRAGDHISIGRIDGYENGMRCGISGHPDRNETIANAAIMTTAPELFEACCDMRITILELMGDMGKPLSLLRGESAIAKVNNLFCELRKVD